MSISYILKTHEKILLSNKGMFFAQSCLIILEIMEDFALQNNFEMAYYSTKASQIQFSFQVSRKHENRK